VDVNRHTAYRLYAYRLYRLGFIELRADSPKQFSWFDLQGLGELHDCHEGQISPTSLNCPHERNVQTRQFCQSLLRQFLPQAKLPHSFAEGGQNDNHKCGHRCAYKTYAAEGWFLGAGGRARGEV